MAQINETDGVRVVMSSAQLAAVLSGRSIRQTETSTNQLWGGLEIVGGVLEMAGASVLCVMPEPTMLSKAGCIVFGVHGADTAAAGIRQVWTTHDTNTLVHQGATKLAETLRAPPEMANNIGLSVDLGVSFGVAGMVRAVRVASVTMGRIDLMQHEAKTLKGPGGHTVLKHVGRTDAQLWERLKAEPIRRYVSTFTNMETAEWAISKIMRAKSGQIKAWAGSSSPAPLPLSGDVGKEVGRVLSRETGKITGASKVTVILKFGTYNGMPYYVVTAYVS